jgi:hypothetical protein
MKSIIVCPDLEHEYQTDFTHHGRAWKDRYLRAPLLTFGEEHQPLKPLGLKPVPIKDTEGGHLTRADPLSEQKV